MAASVRRPPFLQQRSSSDDLTFLELSDSASSASSPSAPTFSPSAPAFTSRFKPGVDLNSEDDSILQTNKELTKTKSSKAIPRLSTSHRSKGYRPHFSTGGHAGTRSNNSLIGHGSNDADSDTANGTDPDSDSDTANDDPQRLTRLPPFVPVPLPSPTERRVRRRRRQSRRARPQARPLSNESYDSGDDDGDDDDDANSIVLHKAIDSLSTDFTKILDYSIDPKTTAILDSQEQVHPSSILPDSSLPPQKSPSKPAKSILRSKPSPSKSSILRSGSNRSTSRHPSASPYARPRSERRRVRIITPSSARSSTCAAGPLHDAESRGAGPAIASAADHGASSRSLLAEPALPPASKHASPPHATAIAASTTAQTAQNISYNKANGSSNNALPNGSPKVNRDHTTKINANANAKGNSRVSASISASCSHGQGNGSGLVARPNEWHNGSRSIEGPSQLHRGLRVPNPHSGNHGPQPSNKSQQPSPPRRSRQLPDLPPGKGRRRLDWHQHLNRPLPPPPPLEHQHQHQHQPQKHHQENTCSAHGQSEVQEQPGNIGHFPRPRPADRELTSTPSQLRISPTPPIERLDHWPDQEHVQQQQQYQNQHHNQERQQQQQQQQQRRQQKLHRLTDLDTSFDITVNEAHDPVASTSSLVSVSAWSSSSEDADDDGRPFFQSLQHLRPYTRALRRRRRRSTQQQPSPSLVKQASSSSKQQKSASVSRPVAAKAQRVLDAAGERVRWPVASRRPNLIVHHVWSREHENQRQSLKQDPSPEKLSQASSAGPASDVDSQQLVPFPALPPTMDFGDGEHISPKLQHLLGVQRNGSIDGNMPVPVPTEEKPARKASISINRERLGSKATRMITIPSNPFSRRSSVANNNNTPAQPPTPTEHRGFKRRLLGERRATTATLPSIPSQAATVGDSSPPAISRSSTSSSAPSTTNTTPPAPVREETPRTSIETLPEKNKRISQSSFHDFTPPAPSPLGNSLNPIRANRRLSIALGTGLADAGPGAIGTQGPSPTRSASVDATASPVETTKYLHKPLPTPPMSPAATITDAPPSPGTPGRKMSLKKSKRSNRTSANLDVSSRNSPKALLPATPPASVADMAGGTPRRPPYSPMSGRPLSSSFSPPENPLLRDLNAARSRPVSMQFPPTPLATELSLLHRTGLSPVVRSTAGSRPESRASSVRPGMGRRRSSGATQMSVLNPANQRDRSTSAHRRHSILDTEITEIAEVVKEPGASKPANGRIMATSFIAMEALDLDEKDSDSPFGRWGSALGGADGIAGRISPASSTPGSVVEGHLTVPSASSSLRHKGSGLSAIYTAVGSTSGNLTVTKDDMEPISPTAPDVASVSSGGASPTMTDFFADLADHDFRSPSTSRVRSNALKDGGSGDEADSPSIGHAPKPDKARQHRALQIALGLDDSLGHARRESAESGVLGPAVEDDWDAEGPLGRQDLTPRPKHPNVSNLQHVFDQALALEPPSADDETAAKTVAAASQGKQVESDNVGSHQTALEVPGAGIDEDEDDVQVDEIVKDYATAPSTPDTDPQHAMLENEPQSSLAAEVENLAPHEAGDANAVIGAETTKSSTDASGTLKHVPEYLNLDRSHLHSAVSTSMATPVTATIALESPFSATTGPSTPAFENPFTPGRDIITISTGSSTPGTPLSPSQAPLPGAPVNTPEDPSSSTASPSASPLVGGSSSSPHSPVLRRLTKRNIFSEIDALARDPEAARGRFSVTLETDVIKRIDSDAAMLSDSGSDSGASSPLRRKGSFRHKKGGIGEKEVIGLRRSPSFDPDALRHRREGQ